MSASASAGNSSHLAAISALSARGRVITLPTPAFVSPTINRPLTSSTLRWIANVLRAGSRSRRLSANASPMRNPLYPRSRTRVLSSSRRIARASRSMSVGLNTGRSVVGRRGRDFFRSSAGFVAMTRSRNGRSRTRLRTPCASMIFDALLPACPIVASQSSTWLGRIRRTGRRPKVGSIRNRQAAS